MESYLNKAIFASYTAFLFLLPIIVVPITSELFEFNKIVLVYLATITITALWITKMITKKEIVFRKTPLDLPIAAFITANIVSAFFSIDRNMSIFGYYSRFNGGLLSLISYSLLYFAFTSNLNKKQTLTILKTIIASTILILIYAILQKAGIDKNIWIQDVQTRVFSTFGQPNWLAAFLVLTFPIAIAMSFREPKKQKYYLALSLVYFLVILFTKSRSGIIGFTTANALFWLKLLLPNKENSKIKPITIYHLLLLIIVVAFGTPWTPSITSLLAEKEIPQETKTSTSLETGGTESGEIRKIVWKGAIQIWKNHPIFGTGPETFALSYFKYQPKEHNLTSEWDFVYNKAHNEYLNYLANTGIAGFLSYTILILASLYLMCPRKKENEVLKTALTAGYVGFLVTNFFGFSVVTTNLLMFLFPAFAITLDKPDKKEKKIKEKENKGHVLFFISLVSLFLILQVIRYWQADVLYNQGKILNKSKKYAEARNRLLEALKKSPFQPIYNEEVAKSNLGIALLAYEKNNQSLTSQFIDQAIKQSREAIKQSPNNFFFRRTYSSIVIQLSLIDPTFQENAEDSLADLLQFAPTDPKTYYNLGLLLARKGEWEKAKEMLEKSIDLKPNYKEPRLALSTVYKKLNETEKAKDELIFILEKIDPNDATAKREIEELR